MGATALYGHKEILVNSSLKATKKIGHHGSLINSGEQSRVIFALLFPITEFVVCKCFGFGPVLSLGRGFLVLLSL